MLEDLYVCTVTINGKGGTVSPYGKFYVQPGIDVVLNIVPDEGYEFEDVIIHSKIDLVYEFRLPRLAFRMPKNDVTLTVYFQESDKVNK